MHQDAVFNSDLDPLIQKAEDFVAKLEANCARVGFLGPNAPQGGGVVADGGEYADLGKARELRAQAMDQIESAKAFGCAGTILKKFSCSAA